MKREHAPAARVVIEAIGEERFRARALVTERQRRFPRWEAERDAGDILGGLLLDTSEGFACGFCLRYANSLAVYEQRVIWFTGGEGKFANGNAASGGEVYFVLGLYGPATARELCVDLFAGVLLWSHFRREISCKHKNYVVRR